MADDFEDDSDDGGGGGGDDWLATFADMATLLLTFFILLFSMSSVDKKKFSESFSSVREAFGGAQMLHAQSESQVAKDAAGVMESVISKKEMIEEQRKSFNEMRTAISRTPLQNITTATFDDGIITLKVPAEALFDKGSEQLRPEAEPYLRALRDMFIKNRQQDINIKGYTDNSPLPKGARFKDNWELSSLRAVNVLRNLLDGGIEPVRLTATGLADLNPVAPNTTEANRALNRRVEFVLERRVGKE